MQHLAIGRFQIFKVSWRRILVLSLLALVAAIVLVLSLPSHVHGGEAVAQPTTSVAAPQANTAPDWQDISLAAVGVGAVILYGISSARIRRQMRRRAPASR